MTIKKVGALLFHKNQATTLRSIKWARVICLVGHRILTDGENLGSDTKGTLLG